MLSINYFQFLLQFHNDLLPARIYIDNSELQRDSSPPVDKNSLFWTNRRRSMLLKNNLYVALVQVSTLDYSKGTT